MAQWAKHFLHRQKPITIRQLRPVESWCMSFTRFGNERSLSGTKRVGYSSAEQSGRGLTARRGHIGLRGCSVGFGGGIGMGDVFLPFVLISFLSYTEKVGSGRDGW